MLKAFANDVFAVVDLETTGTQRQQNDRIIQFGCAIIQNREIVKTYSFLMDPKRPIPVPVENLTGIKNDMVKGKPNFDFYAPKIEKILANTIFVAHNVNFDLPFLNYELTNAGYEPLTGKAIDTVELAQIVFPTYPSYKLKDLTARLSIPHLNPHRADSDALVTAKLLLDVIHKIERLPQATLNTLAALSKGLVRDTNYIFSQIAQVSRQEKRPLGDGFIQVKNLVLRQQDHRIKSSEHTKAVFPKTDSEKKVQFKQGNINFRRAQVNLMNRLHDYLSNRLDLQNQQSLLVEAPNGTGKTLSYLLAYAYELNDQHKLVIATPTKVLQEQILRQEIPQLLRVTRLPLVAHVVKASSHYLDLDGFVQTLYQANVNKPTLILQMGILVWLTQTTTGDLDELQLTNFQAPLFAQIQHPGDARFGSSFSDYDFWNLARYRAEQADILVTNHAYLANHYLDSIWGQSPFLVIDEAHRFVDNVTNSRHEHFFMESFWGMLSHLRHLLYFNDDDFSSKYSDDADLVFLLQQLEKKIIDLIHAINDLQRQLYAQKGRSVETTIRPNGMVESSFTGKTLFDASQRDAFLQKLGYMQAKIEHVRQLTSQILYQLEQQLGMLTSDRDFLTELSHQMDRLDEYSEQAYLLSDQLSDSDGLSHMGFVLAFSHPDDPLSTNLMWLLLDPTTELTQIYRHFSKKLFISATLTDRGNFDFAARQLALKPKTYQTYQGRNTFNLSKHLKIYALSDEKILLAPDHPQFLTQLAQFLIQATKVQAHCLILFSNLDKIRQVYNQIANRPELKSFEILAQGLTGSNERMAKRFIIAKKSLLLGANAFWEGIDFQKIGVDLVIVTQLPFESPQEPEVQLRQARLKNQGKDVFKVDTLPRAILRFRQGCGRLIRNEKDHGAYVILDQRIWKNEYGMAFLDSLPIPAVKLTAENLLLKLKEASND